VVRLDQADGIRRWGLPPGEGDQPFAV